MPEMRLLSLVEADCGFEVFFHNPSDHEFKPNLPRYLPHCGCYVV
jgi:hypothetical protein